MLTMWKIFNIISCCGIMISMVNHFTYAKSYDGATIVISAKGKTDIVNLKKTKTFLANENLPIWSVKNGKLEKLNSDNVMNKLGRFTTYQDPEESSAAVYYHKRRESDGTIDMRYVINGISFEHNEIQHNNNEKNENDQMVTKNTSAPILTRINWGHVHQTKIEKENLEIPYHLAKWIEDELSTENESKCELHDDVHSNFYIETLVVINKKMADQLLGNHRYWVEDVSPIVSYVLTLFNSVDMLFAKINSQNIKINIAGIVIENKRDSIPKVQKCYKKVDLFDKKMESINVFCADESIRTFFSNQKQTIFLDSYDIIVYLARYPLHEFVYNNISQKLETNYLAGLTSSPPEGIYQYKKMDGKLKPTIIIADSLAFGSFPIIAHELVHAFGIPYHDEPSNIINDMCCEKLMKPVNGHCKNCLNWSESTKKYLNNIFKSPNSCVFKNEPHSLYPPQPRRIMTADEQCQCYGYESADNLYLLRDFYKLFWNTISTPIFGYCNTYLRCVDEHKKIHSTPVPMDGTPCDENKDPNRVCWNRVCENIEKPNSIWDLVIRLRRES